MKVNIFEDYHIHCNYNDHSASDLTIKNVIRHAEAIGMKKIAFTEHVRRTSDWIPQYLQEFNSVQSNVDIVIGFEAKILRDGSIDCLPEYMEENFIVASFHTIYHDKQIWLNALTKAIENPYVDVIGHLSAEPEFIIDSREIENIASLIASNNKIVEINAKYKRPSIQWLKIFKDHGVKFHLGSDAHSIGEVGQFESISNLIEFVNGKDD